MADNMMRIAGRGEDGLAKSLSTDNKGKLLTKLSETNSHFDYEIISGGFLFLTERNGVIYGTSQDRKRLHKSVDGGLTFGGILYETTHQIITGHKTQNGALLIFLNNQTVLRTINDIDFIQVLSNIYFPWPSVGIDSSGNVIIFAEYGGAVPNGTVMTVRRSSDGGLTWNIVTSEVVGTNGFNHFHSCQNLSRNRWIVTSADNVIKWFLSTNNGSSFTTMFETKDQRFRTLGIVETHRSNGYRRFIWGSDGAQGSEGVYAISPYVNEFTPMMYSPELIATLPSVSYGLVGNGNILIATSKITDAYQKDKKSRVFVSLNSGKSWQIDKEFDVTSVDGGITYVHGPDSKGCYYLLINGTDFSGPFVTVKMTPNNQIKSYEVAHTDVDRRTTVIINPREILKSSKSILLAPPTWAKSAIFTCRNYAQSGIAPVLKMQTNHFLPNSTGRGPSLESIFDGANQVASHIWGFNGVLGDAEVRIKSLRTTGLPLVDSMLLVLDVAGTFTGAEGIDCELTVTWLP